MDKVIIIFICVDYLNSYKKVCQEKMQNIFYGIGKARVNCVSLGVVEFIGFARKTPSFRAGGVSADGEAVLPVVVIAHRAEYD